MQSDCNITWKRKGEKDSKNVPIFFLKEGATTCKIKSQVHKRNFGGNRNEKE